VTGRDVWVNHYLLFSRENNKKLSSAKVAAAAAAATANRSIHYLDHKIFVGHSMFAPARAN
jgi:hypothetical protein